MDFLEEIESEDRMNCTWSYVLLGEKTFYGLSKNGANTSEIFESPGVKMTKATLKGTLGDYLGIKEY